MTGHIRDSDDDLLTPREVAEMLGVRTATVGMWARTGALKPAMRTPGGHRRYRRADVLAFRTGRGPDAPSPEKERLERDAARLYEQGWSIRQVAARFDQDYTSMRRVLLRHTTLRSGR
jgi:excisionase family DNA binding protein